MSDLPARHRYSDDEVGSILKRAAELQGAGAGLSLEEIEAVAHEAGIDVALVRRAAEETSLARITNHSNAKGWRGAPSRIVLERVSVGETAASDYDDVLTEIRRQLDITGVVEGVGKSFTWRNRKGRDVQVSVVPRHGKTIVRVEENLGPLAGGLFGGLGGGLGGAGVGVVVPICIAALGMPVLIPFGLVAWAAGAFGLARTIYASEVEKRRQQLEHTVNGLAELCRDLAARRDGAPKALTEGSSPS